MKKEKNISNKKLTSNIIKNSNKYKIQDPKEFRKYNFDAGWTQSKDHCRHARGQHVGCSIYHKIF